MRILLLFFNNMDSGLKPPPPEGLRFGAARPSAFPACQPSHRLSRPGRLLRAPVFWSSASGPTAR